MLPDQANHHLFHAINPMVKQDRFNIQYLLQYWTLTQATIAWFQISYPGHRVGPPLLPLLKLHLVLWPHSQPAPPYPTPGPTTLPKCCPSKLQKQAYMHHPNHWSCTGFRDLPPWPQFYTSLRPVESNQQLSTLWQNPLPHSNTASWHQLEASCLKTTQSWLCHWLQALLLLFQNTVWGLCKLP